MTDRRRNLLHKNKLDLFRLWAKSQDYKEIPIPVSAAYEVLRLYRFNGPEDEDSPISFYSRLSGDHITCYGEGTKLVKKFLKEVKKHGNMPKLLRPSATILAFPKKGRNYQS